MLKNNHFDARPKVDVMERVLNCVIGETQDGAVMFSGYVAIPEGRRIRPGSFTLMFSTKTGPVVLCDDWHGDLLLTSGICCFGTRQPWIDYISGDYSVCLEGYQFDGSAARANFYLHGIP